MCHRDHDNQIVEKDTLSHRSLKEFDSRDFVDEFTRVEISHERYLEFGRFGVSPMRFAQDENLSTGLGE